MLSITRLEDGMEVFKALGSEVRIRILSILLENGEMNMTDLSRRLSLSPGALTGHIRLLEECGLIRIMTRQGNHGSQKLCSVRQDKILIELNQIAPSQNTYDTSISIGHYCDCDVYPTCGLSSDKHLIGEVDDRRYFYHNDRFSADILWFTRGYVEYAIPNFIPYDQKMDELCISMEISSEAPGVNENWPSDITFFLNDVNIANWTSPGDFGEVRGLLTPKWWFPQWNQYGLLKMLQINQKGTFIDGDRKSDHTIEEFHLTGKSSIKFRIAVLDTAANVGGVTLFGKSFGNYNQDINVRIAYSPVRSSS